MSPSRGAESAHKDIPPQCGKTGKRKQAHLRKAPSAQQNRLGTCARLKTLITRACLKHSDFIKIENWIEMCLTAVHMKPFSMKERVRRLDRLTHVQLLMRSESD